MLLLFPVTDVGVGAFAEITVYAASLALVAVPECELRVAFHHGLAALGAKSFARRGYAISAGGGLAGGPSLRGGKRPAIFPTCLADLTIGKGYEGTDEYLPSECDALRSQAQRTAGKA